MTERRRPSVAGRVVGVLGELLITAGIVIGLFVVWQVWWTDLQAGSVISAELDDFDDGLPPVTDALADADEQKDGAPAPEIPEDLTAQGIPPTAFAVLHVPRWGDAERVPIAEGISLPRVLNKGFAGHYPGTGNIGQVGNFALAAHRFLAAFHWSIVIVSLPRLRLMLSCSSDSSPHSSVMESRTSACGLPLGVGWATAHSTAARMSAHEPSWSTIS